MMWEAWVGRTADEANETWPDGTRGKHLFYYSTGDFVFFDVCAAPKLTLGAGGDE